MFNTELSVKLNEVNTNLSNHHLQTENELNQLQTSLNTTQSSLDTKLEVLTTNISEHQSQTENNFIQLQTSLTTTQSSLNTKLEALNASLSQHQSQTEDDFDQLQTSLSSTLDSHTTQLNSKLDSLDETFNTSLTKHQQQTEDGFDQLQTSLTTTQSSLDTKLEALAASLSDHQSQTEDDFNQLQTSLTTTQSSLDTKLEVLTASLSEHQTQTEDNLDQLQTSTQKLQNNLTHQLNGIHEDVISILGPYTCGGTGGWRRVVYLDMTDPTSTCPSGWQLTGYSKRTCGRVSTDFSICDSVTFPVDQSYTKFCGRIKAYQWGVTSAFATYDVTTIDGNYVSGLSLTHGSPRQHIWTFAAGLSESQPTSTYVCPCDASVNITVPSFVGEDYFCESGVNEPFNYEMHITFHPTDPLWDGENCLSNSTCCSLHGPPYFTKQLPATTTDDIEARICLHEPLGGDDIAVELIELYAQ